MAIPLQCPQRCVLSLCPAHPAPQGTITAPSLYLTERETPAAIPFWLSLRRKQGLRLRACTVFYLFQCYSFGC